MLAHFLALTVGIGSLAIYMAAFFFPEIHRKNDLVWSGFGLFYALVLWVCAGRITGGLLLGEIAGVAMLGWAVTQTLQLRRQLTPAKEKTPIPSKEEVVAKVPLTQKLGGIFAGLKRKVQQTVGKKTPAAAPTPDAPSKTPLVEVIDKRTDTAEAPTTSAADLAAILEADTETTTTEVPSEVVATTAEETPSPEVAADTEAKTEASVPELIPPNPPSPELVEAATEASQKAHETAEEVAKIPVEEIAPDAELAPPAEAPAEDKPATDKPGG
ncbi:MAG: Ycf66 family protein [Nostocaceae cyanobacterium]|nr:Ycf66 family protein [Nostocaceae cyanobacterium]